MDNAPPGPHDGGVTETSAPKSRDGTVADVIATALRRRGVECIFGQSLPSALILAAERVGIRQLVYRAENAGGAMADGFARVSRTLGIVTAQNGPAASLLVPPLAEASKASVPILALVQEVPRSSRDRNAFQELDHADLFAACTKRVSLLDSPERIEHDLDLLLTTALSGRPGPVVGLLPSDVLRLPAAGGGRAPEATIAYPYDRPRPDADRIETAARLIADAETPLVIAGGGVHDSNAVRALGELQELAGLPVGTTTMGKGAVDERHELSLGMVTSYMAEGSLSHGVLKLVGAADLVVLIGTRTNENGTDAWRLFPEGADFIHLDIDPIEIGRNYPAVRLVGDARAGLEDLTAKLAVMDLSHRRSGRDQLAAAIASRRALDRERAAPLLESPATPLRPERVMGELDALLEADSVVVADASYSTIWASSYLTASPAGRRFISPRGLAGLGWGLPLAIGAQVAAPAAQVVCLLGDGGFAHCWSELETLAREHLPITVIVLDNSILGFQKHAELHKFGAHTGAGELAPIDHSAIAKACGVESARVDDPQRLEEVLAGAVDVGAPFLVEVAIDPDAHPPITAWAGSPLLRRPPLPALPSPRPT